MRGKLWLAVLSLIFSTAIGQQNQLQQPGSQDEIRYLTFRVGMDRIYPEAVNLEEGWYQIRIMNGIATDGITVALDDEAGLALSRGVAQARAGRSKVLVYLKPGKTSLYIPGHPKWRTELQVKPKKS